MKSLKEFKPLIRLIGEDKKKLIIEKASNDMKVFKQFQEAVRLNPNLTYSEFVKSLN